MMEQTGASKPGSAGRAASNARRKIYIKERLPAVATEMKSLGDERKELTAKRERAQPEERKQLNRRWNYLVERLKVLREERAALMEERDGVAPQKKEKQKEKQK